MILRFALIGEGSSDSSLTTIVGATISDLYPDLYLEPYYFTTRALGGGALTAALIQAAHDRHRADVMFVHKDADGVGVAVQRAAIQALAAGLQFPVVSVVPKREMEAWLLADENSIRIAASNRNGVTPLNLPSLNRIERILDPKATLANALWIASGLAPSRRRRFNEKQARARIAESYDCLDSLRGLSSFVDFESETATALLPVVATLSD